jgi:adenine-specific DNA glycosylase
VKAGKTKVKQVALTFHVVVSGELVLMRQRPSDGIWGELWEFPSTWEETSQTTTPKLQQPPISSAKSLRHLGQMGEAFEHILSHRKLNIYFHIWQAETAFTEENGQWLTWSEAQKLPIPRAIEKNWEELEKSMRSARLS